MRFALLAALILSLGGCVAPISAPPAPAPPAPSSVAQTARAAALTFLQVVATVEPVAEQTCRTRGIARNCDFRIVVDDRPGQPPNAFQTIDGQGRPVVGFTLALIRDARNADELAFVLGHEAAHHIAGHIPRRQDQAMTGAVLAGVIAEANGLSPDQIRAAQNLGAQVAARSYSREFELEADALGAEIALIAGYDPILGAGFFDRLPDPGDRFLGSHPPNAQRKAQVAATVRRLQGG
ncbi:M48 family metallopeptidase [Tabrizicola sp.]|uniref:M48 family metallopeptidase n=1 Tax=Tabrizicola sp. TaxID=2005166 RepID=UPI00263477D7|nr:M48 family metallopeptidase [Tabrizicola sp.]MDM7932777.1 M48 family metallopeptidase [Tabrizicola sp.]